MSCSRPFRAAAGAVDQRRRRSVQARARFGNPFGLRPPVGADDSEHQVVGASFGILRESLSRPLTITRDGHRRRARRREPVAPRERVDEVLEVRSDDARAPRWTAPPTAIPGVDGRRCSVASSPSRRAPSATSGGFFQVAYSCCHSSFSRRMLFGDSAAVSPTRERKTGSKSPLASPPGRAAPATVPGCASAADSGTRSGSGTRPG
jgi:hypothetical protein